LNKPQKRADEIRQKLRIDVDGEDVPPPLIRFEDFKFPRPMIEFINSKGITKPTPIQIQGLPVVYVNPLLIVLTV
jgi:ATP-dependent RNA helicase DDX41